MMKSETHGLQTLENGGVSLRMGLLMSKEISECVCVHVIFKSNWYKTGTHYSESDYLVYLHYKYSSKICHGNVS